MAYNYLELVNDLNRRVNETELSSSNFADATGFYNTAKDAINSSIRLLNQEQFQWPFNYLEQEDVLTAGDMRYDIPYNAKTIDYNTFRIKRYVDSEYNEDTSIRKIPTHVIRAPGNQYIVYPSPDKDYELIYEMYSLPVDLILHSDVPSAPEAYRHIIVDGAMYYVQTFRNDNQSAQMSLQKFTEGVKNMKSIYINRFEYLYSTRVSF
jgi:hypothetical protein